MFSSSVISTYVNRLLDVITPVNRKVAVLYFKTFTGFAYSADEKQFGKKNKKNYDAALATCNAFLEDPLNNIWTWAERNIDVEEKQFELSKVTTTFASFIKKADKAGIKQVDLLKAVMNAGVTVDTLLELMQSLDGIDVNIAE